MRASSSALSESRMVRQTKDALKISKQNNQWQSQYKDKSEANENHDDHNHRRVEIDDVVFAVVMHASEGLRPY